MATYRERVAAAKRRITEIEPAELEARLDEVLVIDVREPHEYQQGAVEGARLVPRGILERTIDEMGPGPGAEIVLYCDVGNRSALAAEDLGEMGFERVRSLAGGIERWKREGRSWQLPATLSDEQRVRYSRHTVLPEIGEEGQARLLGSGVLIVGAGGLGSPAALYLAAAGVGRLGIVDDDIVDVSSLQRQILHDTHRLGRLKADSAREALVALNPGVNVEPYRVRLAADNVLDIMDGYDAVVDGGDNFPTRYLVNDAALHLRTPIVHGSLFRFEGQVTTFVPYRGPCYRCLFPEPPPPELSPACAEVGVIGAVPGVIGSMQAVEAIKLLLGLGDLLVGRLLSYDALSQRVTTFEVERDPACPACADEDRPPRLVVYDDACAPAGTVARRT